MALAYSSKLFITLLENREEKLRKRKRKKEKKDILNAYQYSLLMLLVVLSLLYSILWLVFGFLCSLQKESSSVDFYEEKLK